MHKIKARIQYASENLEDSPTPFSGLKKGALLFGAIEFYQWLYSNHPLTHLHSQQKLEKLKTQSLQKKQKNGPIFPTKNQENLPKIDSGKFEIWKIWTRIWNKNFKIFIRIHHAPVSGIPIGPSSE